MGFPEPYYVVVVIVVVVIAVVVVVIASQVPVFCMYVFYIYI